MDSVGNVYVAWNRSNGSGDDTPMFCKFAIGSSCTSPVSLSLPGPNPPPENNTTGNFSILGPGSTVYVVAPRYVDSDVVVWTSTDGGATFSAGTVIANGYEQSIADNVLLQGSNLLIGGFNVGLSFDSTPISGAASPTFVFNNPGPGGVSSGSLGSRPERESGRGALEPLEPGCPQLLLLQRLGKPGLADELDRTGTGGHRADPLARRRGHRPLPAERRRLACVQPERPDGGRRARP
jgi:hypothetical protein